MFTLLYKFLLFLFGTYEISNQYIPLINFGNVFYL